MPHPVDYWTGERYYRPYRIPYDRRKQKKIYQREMKESESELEKVKKMSDKEIIWHELYQVTGK